MYNVEITAIETISAIACFILVRIMIKPFLLTRENRYLGLPLGFGLLGVSYSISALTAVSGLSDFLLGVPHRWWIQLFFRAFAFLFLAITYFFSKSPKKRAPLWNTVLGAVIVIFTILILFSALSPESLGPDYKTDQIIVRLFNISCLAYITIHALKSHMEQPDPTTLTIPFGYILLGTGQFLQIIWSVDNSMLAFWTGIMLRLAGLAVFLFVSYLTFIAHKKE